MSAIDAPSNDARTLRLVWPQWQGAGRQNVGLLLPALPEEAARHGYVAGARLLDAILTAHAGPTAAVPADRPEPDEGSTAGIEARSASRASRAAAQAAIARHDADRIP